MGKRKIEFNVQGARWFDRSGGNTYHAVLITRTSDGATLRCPLQYGYGDCYRQTALEAMAKAGWLPPEYSPERNTNGLDIYCYDRENGYPIEWIVTDGLKRDAVALGSE